MIYAFSGIYFEYVQNQTPWAKNVLQWTRGAKAKASGHSKTWQELLASGLSDSLCRDTSPSSYQRSNILNAQVLAKLILVLLEFIK